jgi:hypothetical protein
MILIFVFVACLLTTFGGLLPDEPFSRVVTLAQVVFE